MGTPSHLKTGAVDLEFWFARTEGAIASAARKRLASFLSDDELRVRDAFVRDKDACAYEVAHGLLRFALSHHGERKPAEWQFRKLRLGKPVLEDGSLESLVFNLSHTSGFVACAIGSGESIGVDVESAAQARAVKAVAPRQFSPAELAWLGGLDTASSETRAIEQWTLKEAFVKSTGEGLQAGLDRITILNSETGCPELIACDTPAHLEKHWRFARLRFDDKYFVAIAIESTRRSGGLRVMVRELTFPDFTTESALLPASPKNSWRL